MKWTVYRFSAAVENVGQRLDIFIAGQTEELSRSQIKKIIDLGGVHLNGRRVRSCSLSVSQDDAIEVYLDHYSLEPYRLEDNAIVYADQYLMVVNKPAHIDTQPTHARYKGTLYEALLNYLKDPFRPQRKPELGMVQRLDRGTSGLIAFSIHPRAHKAMTQIFLEHRVEKRYLALVKGVPDPASAEIRSFLARTRKENKVKSVTRGGKEAITRFRTVETFKDAALLELDLITGRSHQIRAHLSERGHPLLGDRRYGGPSRVSDMVIGRPQLHSASLTFRHPVSGIELDFSVPLPDDMNELIERLKTPYDDISPN